jgi:hypothetical protein
MTARRVGDRRLEHTTRVGARQSELCTWAPKLTNDDIEAAKTMLANPEIGAT